MLSEQQKQGYQFEVGQWVKIISSGLLQGTTGKIEERKTSSFTESLGSLRRYLINGKWCFEYELEARTLDAFEQFLVEKGALDLYDRAHKSGYRVRAVLPDGRIQGEYQGGNESWYKNYGTFTGTRTEVEAFLSAREQDLNAL